MKPPVYEHIGKLQKTQKPYIFRCQVQAIAAAMQQRAEQLQLPMPRLVVGQNIARPGRVAGPKRLQRQREGLNQPKQANGHFCGESYGQVSPKFDRDGLRMFLQWFQISATDLVILVDFTVLCWQLVTGQCKEMETEKKLGGESMDSPCQRCLEGGFPSKNGDCLGRVVSGSWILRDKADVWLLQCFLVPAGNVVLRYVACFDQLDFQIFPFNG